MPTDTMQHAVVVPTQTDGTSPKTILAATLPAIGTLLAIAIQWIITGEFNRPELVTAVTGVSTSLFAGLGAWLGHPGNVVLPMANLQTVPSDALLDPEVLDKLASDTEPDPPRPTPLDTGQ